MDNNIGKLVVGGIVFALCWLAAGLAHGHDRYGSYRDREGAPQAEPATFSPGATYQICFVPDGASCERMLINAIDQTQSSLMIQAYSFTSAPIAKAVVEAKRRGVDVRVIVDKSQRTEKYSIVTFLNNAEIPVVVDSSVKIAHNKVMIFDQQAVFLGSFNFTKAAEHMNAENGMLIRGDASIVSAYTQNWKARYRVSEAP